VSNTLLIVIGSAANITMSWWLLLSVPLLAIAVRDVMQRRHAILRNYPLIGHLRYFYEAVRPELRQYFFKSDLDGKRFNRRQRSIVYQRAKNEKRPVCRPMLWVIRL
ncbi:MAG TPA: hypothetical protein VM884_05600, partial [Flavisolibacter sp.]|nr:hypothetical protein [Flavisolibacter sp.]